MPDQSGSVRPAEGAADSQRWLNRNVVMMSLASLFSDMSHEAATAILPLYLAYLGAGAEALGLIEGASDAASSLLKFLSGHYSDRVGSRKEIAILGYSLTAIGKAAVGFATTWPTILGLRVIAWMGRGSRGPVRDAMMADSVPPEKYGRAFGLHRAMDTVGAIAGPAIALLLVSRVHFKTIFLLTFIPGMAAVFAIAAVRDKPGPRSRVKMREAMGKLPTEFRWFLAATGLFGLGNFAHTLLILRASDLLQPHYGARASGIAIAFYTLHNVLYALTAFPAGRAGDHMDRRYLLMAGYSLFTVVAVGFAFANSLWTLAIFFIGAGVYVGIVDAVESSYAAQLLPPEVRGGGFGSLGLVKGIGDLISSAAVGWLWSAFSPVIAFNYAATVSFAGVLVLLFRPGRAPAGRVTSTAA